VFRVAEIDLIPVSHVTGRLETEERGARFMRPSHLRHGVKSTSVDRETAHVTPRRRRRAGEGPRLECQPAALMAETGLM
jgi:hypothetical protein